MSKACPNPKSAEWKRLNRQVDLIEAVRTYVAHGYRVPIVDSVPDIKKAIGFRKTISTRVLIRIQKRIEIFNKHNENAHRLQVNDVGSGTHNIILVLNYQPRNEIMHEMRKAARSDTNIIKVVDSPYGDTKYESIDTEAYQRYLYNQGRTQQDAASDQALEDQDDNVLYQLSPSKKASIIINNIEEYEDAVDRLTYQYLERIQQLESWKSEPQKIESSNLRSYIKRIGSGVHEGEYEIIFFKNDNDYAKYFKTMDDALVEVLEYSNYYIRQYSTILFSSQADRTEYLDQLIQEQFEKAQKNEDFRDIFLELANKNMLQIDTSSTKEANEQIDAKIKAFIEGLGFTISNVNEIRDKNGDLIDAVAKVDMVNKLIEIAEGRAGIDTLAEEAAHILILLLRDNNDPLFDELMDGIENTPEYAEVKEQYTDVYGTNEALYKLEAVGKIIAKEVVNQETRSLLRKIIDAIKKFFGKVTSNPYKKAALIMLNNDTAGLSTRKLKSTESLYQLSVEDITRRFKETAERFEVHTIDVSKLKGTRVYKGIGETVDRYYDIVRDVISGNRPTDFTDKKFVKAHGKKKALEIRNRLKSIISRDSGTKLHGVAAELIDYHVNKKGSPGDILKRSDLNAESFKVLDREVKALIKQARDTQNSIDPTKEPTFFIEQTLHNQNKDLTGSADLIVLFSDSSASLFDFKFITYDLGNSIGQGGHRIATSKIIGDDRIQGFETQLATYMDIMQKQYGVTKIRQSRIIPAAVAFHYEQGTGTMTNRVKQIDMGSHSSVFLSQILSSLELPSFANLNSAMESQLRLLEDIRQRIERETDFNAKEALKLTLESVKKAINQIQVNGDLRLTLTYMDELLNKLNGNEETGKLYEIEDELADGYMDHDELRQASAELGIYKDILNNSSRYFGSIEEADKALFLRVKRHIERLNLDIDIVRNAVNDKMFMRQEQELLKSGVTPQKTHRGLSWRIRNFGTLSEAGEHPVFRALWDKITKGHTETRRKTEAVDERLKKLLGDLKEWGNRNSKTVLQIFEMMIDGDRKNLVHTFKSELYDKRNDAISSGDIAWLKENWEVRQSFHDTLVARRDKYEKILLDKYPDNPATEIQDAIDQSATRKQELRIFDIQNNVNNKEFWMNGEFTKRNIELKAEKHAEWYSDKYKVIRVNKPLLEFYDYYMEKNQEFREIVGYDRITENFVANIKKDIISSLFFSGGGNKMRAIKESLLSTISVHQDGVLGQMDTQTGGITGTIPIFYLNPLKDSRGNVDYSNKSIDLAKNLLLFAESVYNYEQSKLMETGALALRDFINSDKYREVAVSEADKTMKGRFQTDLINENPEETRKQFETYLNYYIYGQRIQSKDRHFTLWGRQFSMNKMIQTMMQYMSIKVLGGSVIAPLAAGAAGRLSITFEAAKGEFFDRKAMKQAEKNVISNNKLDRALFAYFDTQQESLTHRKANRLSATKATRYITTSTAFMGFRLADEMNDKLVLGAMSRTHGIDESGNIKHLETLPEGSKSIRDLTKIIDDKVVIDGLNGNAFNSFRQRVKHVAGTTKGQMSEEDISAASTKILFKMFMQFKTWMPRLLAERFGGLRYTPSTESFSQGRYIIMYNEVFGKNRYDAGEDAIYGIDKEIGNLGKGIASRIALMTANVLFLHKLNSSWEMKVDKGHAEWALNKFRDQHDQSGMPEKLSLDDFIRMRQGQIRAGIMEVRMQLLFFAALIIANGDWDDDDEKNYKRFWVTRKLLQVVNRSQSELAFFYNPMELRNWFKGMIPMFGLVEDMYRGIENFFDETFDVITGRSDSHDKTPFGYYGMDWFPGMNKMSSFIELFDQDREAIR